MTRDAPLRSFTSLIFLSREDSSGGEGILLSLLSFSFFFSLLLQLDQRWKNVEPVSISDDAFPFFPSNGKSLGYFGALQQRFREILSRSLCVSVSHYRFEGDEYY